MENWNLLSIYCYECKKYYDITNNSEALNLCYNCYKIKYKIKNKKK